jgi:ABC-type tungstate transport system substrate-binding protein
LSLVINLILMANINYQFPLGSLPISIVGLIVSLTLLKLGPLGNWVMLCVTQDDIYPFGICWMCLISRLGIPFSSLALGISFLQSHPLLNIYSV